MKAISFVALLLFMGILLEGTILESTAVMKYYNRSSADFRSREIMKELLDAMLAKFNDMAPLETDYEHNSSLADILNAYAEYDLAIKDISSGLNLNFLPDDLLSEPGLANFLFAGGSAENFLNFRRNTGFVMELSAWEPFLQEKALESAVCYGWLSAIHENTEAGQMLAASFGRTGEDLYPAMNAMPLMNVNFIDLELIAPLFSNRSWQIPEALVKAAALKSKLEQGPVTEWELRAILGLPESHDVYRYIGAKTAFWALSYKNGHYRMDAVIAAIPERGGTIITRYVLIEGRLSREV